jgi:hypothetical protein
MSGLVKLVKKVYKPIRETAKKVFKSKIFKVVAIAAAAVFTGGAALGALGAAGGGGIMATLSAGFQAGMSALGSIGSAIWTGVKAAGTAVKGFFMPGTAAGAAVPSGAAANAGYGAAELAALQGGATAGKAAAGAAGMDSLTKAALITTGGNMIAGYAQGKAQEEQLDEQERRRLNRDAYGYDGYGRKTGDLVNPADIMAQASAGSRIKSPLASLDQAPGTAAPTVARPGTGPMQNRLLASLDELRLSPAYGG